MFLPRVYKSDYGPQMTKSSYREEERKDTLQSSSYIVLLNFYFHLYNVIFERDKYAQKFPRVFIHHKVQLKALFQTF